MTCGFVRVSSGRGGEHVEHDGLAGLCGPASDPADDHDRDIGEDGVEQDRAHAVRWRIRNPLRPFDVGLDAGRRDACYLRDPQTVVAWWLRMTLSFGAGLGRSSDRGLPVDRSAIDDHRRTADPIAAESA
jgi:hypothetical protein